MKAKNLSTVEYGSERRDLYTVLPLSTPYTVYIDPSRSCNFRCKFCAIHHAGAQNAKESTLMRYEDFVKVVNDMKGFPEKIKTIVLSNSGEPLVNKRLPDMIRYIKDADVAMKIEFVTNGSLLTHEMSDAVAAAGLDEIRFSIEGVDADAYEKVCGVRVDYDKLVENIKYLYEHKGNMFVYVKTIDACLTSEDDKNRFYATFGDICDSVFVESLADIWPGFGEIHEYFDFADKYGKVGRLGQAVKGVGICSFPFYTSVINPNGLVTVCCTDWEQKVVFGNAFVENYCDIWNGKVHMDFLRAMIKDGKAHTSPALCAICTNPPISTKDALDGHRLELLQAFGIGD